MVSLPRRLLSFRVTKKSDELHLALHQDKAESPLSTVKPGNYFVYRERDILVIPSIPLTKITADTTGFQG